ncbi:hypothetical protein I317_04752 [Kwoniella heveanensis CBS 569]|nr:hypothetical protein I317_04752 [Kwoniella heveanensis CBS 569]
MDPFNGLPPSPSSPETSNSFSMSRPYPQVDYTTNSHQAESSSASHVTVHEWGPREGQQGTQISIKCDVNFPSTTPPPRDGSPRSTPSMSSGKALRVVFGGHPVQTAVHLLQTSTSQLGQSCQMVATVPSLSCTNAPVMGYGSKVNVYVQVLAENHAVIEQVPLGEFMYSGSQPRANPLKRGGETLESSRPSPHQVHRRVISTNSATFTTPELQQYPTMPSTYHPSPSGRSVSDSVASWQSPYMASGPSTTPHPPPYTPGLQPSLMRSSQLGPGLPTPAPYVNSGQKAALELNGDLLMMSKGWSQEEWHARRRLVQFWRRQEGTTIHAAFKPISQADYPAYQQSIIISCIFREDKNACYVTSVDAIYLLEALVGTRFTVEEKNRIRRNLEGFRPITISKSKPGNEDFFRLIMNFPNPRPRNIEKDVKVFPWEILSQALKKIIGKYSASFPYPSNPMPPPPPPGPLQPAATYVPGPLQPMPIENEYVKHEYVGGPPNLTSSNSGSDSSSYAQSYPNPHTPSQQSASPTAYRNNTGSTPHLHNPNPVSEEKGYLNLSPPYGQSNSQWIPESDSGGNFGLTYDQHQTQLPHVHQSVSRQPSSSDLRVVYPALQS